MKPVSLSSLPSNGTARNELTFAQLKTYRVSHQTKHPSPTPIIRIAGANYGLQGMISGLTGPPKSGKTTVIGYMLAGTLTHVSDPSQMLNIKSMQAGQRDVVYLDFEQHVSSTQDLHDKVLRYANISTSPDNLHILNLLGYTMDQRREAIRVVFRELDMHLLIIDGLADLLAGVNDEEKSNQLIEELALNASNHDTCVVVVIHENKNGGSIRGHLGSQIERKCAGLLAVRKDRITRIHSIESKLIRIGDDFDDVCFQYSEEHRRMVLLDAVSTANHIKNTATQKPGKNEDPELLSGLAKLAFDSNKIMTKTELVEAIRKYDRNAGSIKTAKRRIDGMLELNILKLDNENYARAI